MKRIQWLAMVPIVTMIFMSSCINYKKVPYFSDIPQQDTAAQIQNPYQSPVIQKNDIISITVGSISPEANALFSFNSGSTVGGNYSTGSNYMVDMDGNIEIPLINKVKVEGLTTKQARDEIQSKLQSFLKEPIVEVRISNFKVAVLGAVSSPGVINSTNERFTLLDAISMAGDLQIDAHRENVLLIREVGDKRIQVRLDLNSSALLNSPYYYLRNNDILYIQPGRLATRDINFRSLAYLFTALSIFALIQSYVK